MRRRLLAVQGPIQFIAGYVAMEWYNYSRHESEETETVLLMYDFLMPEHMEAEFVNAITRMAGIYAWNKIIFIGCKDMLVVMRGNYSRKIKKLRQLVGFESFDEVIIGRDFCGDGSPLIINAYSEATKILYGDSLGIVGNESITNRFDWRAPLRYMASRFKRALLDFVYGTHIKFRFDAAVLTLPVVWSGKYLDNVPLIVPKREFVVRQFSLLSDELPELKTYADAVIDDGCDNYLFLLSNLSASGLMSEENEVEMYIEIINRVAPEGATVLLKAHPRAPRQVFRAVSDSVSMCHKVVIVDDKELSNYPVELWSKFITDCSIVPIYSASAYHIQYLYGKNVIIPLDSGLIRKYFYPDKMDVVSKGYLSIVGCLNNLSDWDSRSPLWSGN